MAFFDKKTVWITGASSGIGESLVQHFAREGCKIVLSARRIDELQRVQQNCGLSDTNSLILPLDLAQPETFADKTQQVINMFERIDILINNGGISTRSIVEQTSLDIDRQIMEVNFFGTVALTKAVLPYMIKQKQGHIVVTSSIAGKTGMPLRAPYAASKHALHGYFDSLRCEVAKYNIHVLLLCPGYIKTAISLHAITSSGEKHNKMDKTQAEGLHPDVVSRKTLKAIIKRKEELYVGRKEILAVYLKRFAPWLLSRILRRMANKVIL